LQPLALPRLGCKCQLLGTDIGRRVVCVRQTHGTIVDQEVSSFLSYLVVDEFSSVTYRLGDRHSLEMSLIIMFNGMSVAQE